MKMSNIQAEINELYILYYYHLLYLFTNVFRLQFYFNYNNPD